MQKLVFGFILLIGIMTACNTSPDAPEAPQASVAYTLGETIASYTFDDDLTWQSFGLEIIQFGAWQGTYHAISAGGGYIWSLNYEEHSDVVMEVDVKSIVASDTGSYGVICRAHPSNNGMGYYFLLDGAGRYGIRRGDGTRVHVLTPWEEHPAIRNGVEVVNSLRVICIDDYLALYINGEFAAETRDDWFKSGMAGITANAIEGNPVAADFDDLTIWEAALGS